MLRCLFAIAFVAACSHSPSDPNMGSGSGKADGDGSPDAGHLADGATTGGPINGWVEYAAFTSPTPVVKLTATFVVPELPHPAATFPPGQWPWGVFYPGFEPMPPHGEVILQPVVGYDLDPANRGWTMLGADCCELPSPWASENKPVATGDEIHFTIQGSSCNATGACTTWSIGAQDITSGTSSVFTTHDEPRSFHWVFGGVLEAYSVTSCDQLPPAGRVAFTNIVVTDINGAVVATPWEGAVLPYNSSPACGYSAEPGSDSVVLHF